MNDKIQKGQKPTAASEAPRAKAESHTRSLHTGPPRQVGRPPEPPLGPDPLIHRYTHSM